MATMRFADEVVSPEEISEILGEDGGKPQKRELEMAQALIDSLTSEFDPSQYHDEYREQLLALIERKAKGEAIVAPESEEPTPTKAPDLMAALEESLAAVKGEEAKAKPAPRPKRKAASTSSNGKGSKTTKSRSRSKAKASK